MRSILLLVLVLALSVLPAMAQDGSPQPIGVNIVIEVQGAPMIQRVNRVATEPVAVGMVVHPADILRMTPGAVVTVVCSNYTVDVISHLDRSIQCGDSAPSPEIWLLTPASTSQRGSRGGGDDLYLILPRNSKTTELRPAFRWSAHPSAARYEVTLIQNGNALWTITTEMEAINYPAEQPDLQVGTYTLSIEPLNGAGTRIPGVEAAVTSFVVVPSVDYQRGLQQLSSLTIPATADAAMLNYLQAVFYDSHELDAQSIQIIQNLVDTQAGSTLIHSPAPYLRLGDLYSQLGLPNEATNAYHRALEIALAQENLMAAADAYSQLGLYGFFANDVGETIRYCHLQVARDAYALFGDDGAMARIDPFIGAISSGSTFLPPMNCQEVVEAYWAAQSS